MALAALVFEAASPAFLLALVGFAWARAGRDYPTDFVSRLAFTTALPALLFTSLSDAAFAPQDVARLAGAVVLAYGSAALVTFAALRALRLPSRAWLIALVNGNTGNLGLPLVLFAFGPEGLAIAVTLFAVQNMLLFTFGVWLVSGEATPREALRQPTLYAALAGFAAGMAGWQPPVFADRALELAAGMAIPLMLLTLGVSVARLEVGDLVRASGAAALRLLPCGAAGIFAAWALALPPLAADVLTLHMLAPAAVTSYLIAARYGRPTAPIAGLIVVSTALAALYLPGALALVMATGP
jgi:predicted permease